MKYSIFEDVFEELYPFSSANTGRSRVIYERKMLEKSYIVYKSNSRARGGTVTYQNDNTVSVMIFTQLYDTSPSIC